jgi:hypothetical protein
MPLQLFFGVMQSLLALQLLAPKQCTLAGVAAAAGVAPAKASETAAIARAAPERVLFFIGCSCLVGFIPGPVGEHPR